MENAGYSIDAMQVLRSSWVILLMFVLSIVVVAVSIERWIYFARTKLDSDKFLEKIKAFVIDGKYNEAISYHTACHQGRARGTQPAP
jgi:hypothetical protein